MKRFFFKWQRIVMWVFGGVVGLFLLWVKMHGYPWESSLRPIVTVFNLLTPIAMAILYTAVPMAIGQGIYRIVTKKKRTEGEEFENDNKRKREVIMGKLDLRGASEIWEEESGLTGHKGKKKEEPFFFKWQRLVIWLLGGGMGLTAGIFRIVQSGGFYSAHSMLIGIFVGLIIPVFTGVLFVLIPMAIGQGIYRAIMKKRKGASVK